MTHPRLPGPAPTAALLLAVSLVGFPLAPSDAKPPPDVAYPALVERIEQGRPLPWVFPLFQRGTLATVDTASRYLLEDLLRHARPGSQVRIASQRWDRYWNRGADRPLASFPLDRYSGPDCWAPLAEAVSRGVNVSVVQNGRTAAPRVLRWLQNPSGPGECPVSLGPKAGAIRVKVCTRPAGEGGGCLGDGGMQASFFSFDHVDLDGVDLHSVVAITGARYDNRHLHEQNDWIVVIGDRALQAAVNAYFDAMFAAPDEAPATPWPGLPDGESFRHDAAGATPGAASGADGADSAPVSISFHPRPDFVQLDALKQVECDPTARIRVLMAPPAEGPGGSALLDALRRLGRAGCQVEALMRERTVEESEALIEQLAKDDVSVLAVPRISGAFFTSRYVLVDAKLGGKRRRLVFTGGASFDPETAGRSEEILVRIEDDEVFRAYEAQVDLLCGRLNCRIAPAE